MNQWRLFEHIKERRIEAEMLGLEARQTMQSVINSYERLIAMVESLEKRKDQS